MKRKLLTLLIGLNSLFVISQTFPIDPSFESYLIAEGIDSNPFPDNAISFDDASKVTNTVFNLNNLDIQTLSGIENFIFLEEVHINGGSLNLVQLDFSQNKLLKEIDTNIPNLSSLVVNGADALERIRVGPTQLTSLDVSQNLELSSLSIYGSLLTSIDVSANSKLSSFVLGDTNTLTSDIELSSNDNLTTVVVLNSNLEALDLINKPLLSYVDFSNSTISDLTIENAPSLTTFATFTNSNMANLRIDNTVLTSLDFSTVNSLEILDIRNCLDLTNLVLPPANSNLRDLTIYASIFNDNDPATQFNYNLSNRPSLEKLEIWQSGITNLTIENCTALNDLIVGEHIAGMTELQNLVITNTAITEFNLGNNNAELLNIEIENNPSLTEITTSGNGLSTVERLSVVDNALTQLNISNFSNIETLSVRNNPNLSSLDLTTINNGLPNSLITFEGENTGIETLDFSTSPNIEIIRLAYNSGLGGVPLNELNLKNGNNAAITELNTAGHYPTLSCIQVDAATVGTSPSGWSKDSQTVYSEDCSTYPPVLVSFILPNEVNWEDSGTPTPRLLLEGTVTTPTSIILFTSSFAGNNIADPATDYDLDGGASLEVQIPAGIYDTFTSILVPGLNISSDSEFEGNEVVFLEAFSNSRELVNASDGASLDQGSLIYSYTILEDDYRINITAGPNIAENGSNGNFTISIFDDNGNGVINESGRDMAISLLNNGDAIEGVDFTIDGSSIDSFFIANGQGSSIMTVEPIDDNLFEDGEFIDLEITEGEGYYLDPNTGAPFAGISILDNDNHISLSSTQIGLEGGADIGFSILLSDGNGNPAVNDTPFDIEFEVDFLPGIGTDAAVLGTDFIDGIKNNVDKTLYIQPAQESITFEVEVINDTDPENQENFITAITTTNQGLGLVIDNDQATGFINDNDDNQPPPPFEITPLLEGGQMITPTEYNFQENSSQELTVLFDISDPSATDQNFEGYDFQIVSGNGTAIGGDPPTDGSDYYAVNEVVNLTYDFSGFPLLTLGINNDNTTEDAEYYYVDISENETGVFLKDSDINGVVRIRVNIIDDDGTDIDNDGVIDSLDNCPNTSNTDQANLDGDAFGDVCDEDIDGDGYLNTNDAFPMDPAEWSDTDQDGVGDNSDNCVTVANPNQEDADANGIGDVCEGNNDYDNDGIPNDVDNCPNTSNSDQANLDGDAFGDVCDEDIDGDGYPNTNDAFPMDASEWSDTDQDGVGDNSDNCVTVANPNQEDADANGIGDACEGNNDYDNDGIPNDVDNCPNTSNSDQANLDNDSLGDVCDPDIDGDGIDNDQDVFPRDSSESSDNDNDGIGDNADSDDDNDGVPDIDDDCPYVSGTPAENGCLYEITSFDQEALQVVVQSETCEGEENGSFVVTIDNEDYTFTVSLNGNVVGSANYDNAFEQNNLARGSYQVCLTVPELPDYEQCFGIVVSTYERLSVDANAIDATNLKASFIVQGSKNYEALVNDNIYRFQFENTSNKILEIPINKGQNLVSITGGSDCQGIFEDVIIIGNVSIFPNPVKDILNFSGFERDGKAQINIFTLSGSLVKTIHEEIENGDITVQLPDLPKGIYLFKVVSGIEIIEFKIIKE